MAQASQKLHLPYAIRFMARLHEQAAQSCDSDDKSAGLQQEAVEMRLALDTLDRPAMPVRESADLPQKIKLLNWQRLAK